MTRTVPRILDFGLRARPAGDVRRFTDAVRSDAGAGAVAAVGPHPVR